MAHRKKTYSRAQSQTVGQFKQDAAGWVNFAGLVAQVGKAIPKSNGRSIALKFMGKLSKDIGIKTFQFFGKLIARRGNLITFYVSKGRTSGQAAYANEYYYVRWNINSSVPNYVRKVKNPKRLRRRSIRLRRRRRRYNRAHAAKRSKMRMRDQVVIDLVEMENLPTEEESFQVPEKDFSDIFVSAASGLYSEEVEVVETEPIPKISKFLGLGIPGDRPNIIANLKPSIELARVGKNFDKAVAQRFIKIENVFKKLENLENFEDFEALKEAYDLRIAQAKDTKEILEEIRLVEEQINEAVQNDAKEDLKEFGFTDGQNASQAFLQAVFDLSRFPFLGSVAPMPGYPRQGRNLDSAGLGLKYQRHTNAGRTIVDYYAKPDQWNITVAGTKFDLLQGYGKINYSRNSAQKPLTVTSITSAPWWLRLPWGTGYRFGGRSAAFAKPAAQIYSELVMSRLTDLEHPIPIEIKKNIKTGGSKGDLTNLSKYFLKDIFDQPKKDLSSVDNPTRLTSIAKYKIAGKTFYPFEESISSLKKNSQGAPISGLTFFEGVIQPAMGDILEGRKYDLGVMDTWVEKSQKEMSTFTDFVDVFIDYGGPLIVLNEIVIAVLKTITEDGSLYHPVPGVTNNLWDQFNDPQSRMAIIIKAIQRNRANALPFVFSLHSFNGDPRDIYNMTKDAWVDIYSEAGFSTTTINSMFTSSRSSQLAKNKPFTPGDSDDMVRLHNTTISVMSTLFNNIKIGIENSISVMLEQQGIASTPEKPQYQQRIPGYYTPEKQTQYSNVPEMGIDLFIMQCLNALNNYGTFKSMLSNTAAWERHFTKLAAVVVENMDPEEGPVRWKVTKGDLPSEASFADTISENFIDDLVPIAVQGALENPTPDVDVTVDESGNVDVEMDNPLEGWEFLQSSEIFCPITLILENEDRSINSPTLTMANRGPATPMASDCIEWRIHGQSYKQFLMESISKFEQIPNILETIAGSDNLKAVEEISQFPGIEGTDVVRFGTKNQSFLMERDIMVQKGVVGLNYLPSKYATSIDEFLCAKVVVRSEMDQYDQPEISRFQSVGIPAGLLSGLGSPYTPINLRKYATFAFFMDHEFQVQDNFFMQNIFLIPGSFANCDPNNSIQGIVQKAKYLVMSDGFTDFLTYEKTVEKLEQWIEKSGKEVTPYTILKNHVISHSINLCAQITTGITFDENTFRVDNKLPNLIMEPDAVKALAELVTGLPEDLEGFFEEGVLKSPDEILKYYPDLTASELNEILAAFESRILSAPMIPASTCAIRLFDRVFNFITHPSQYHVQTSTGQTRPDTPGLKEVSKSSPQRFKIDMEESPMGNVLYNDHIASYSFDIEV